ncbi:alpha-1,2-fucosyltransferase [Anaeromusa acidaminophila]|uniref:alpha-1,2-fucosyltransferase n=1 Tax=Anaeromusa acidaminophila TaxID=81464 RepID=UPI001FDF3328|nr:alpha-1,2-fucosyltransferase [Anaeromusa acidaminophila]
MFQYALGRAMAKHYSETAAFDLSWYEQKIKPGFEASVCQYNIELSRKDRPKAWYEPILKRISRHTDKLEMWFGLFFEKKYHYDSTVFERGLCKKNITLDGYWQSYKYFSAIEDDLRRELTIPKEREELIAISRSLPENSVSIHVRRGDYVSNPKANAMHGTCSWEYYQAAIEKMTGLVKEPQYVVFSDDITWTKENLPLPNAMYIGRELGLFDYEELILMSRCKHNIMANSTFSWWGAWLNSNPNKVVIAPRKWFRHKKIKVNDLFPSSWVVL